ncbi:MAG: hypothetical protein AB1560_05070 [Pseudomonadota bacterium]
MLIKRIKDIWFQIERRLLPFAPPEHSFIQWCESEPSGNATNSFKVSDKGPGNPPNKQQLDAFFKEIDNTLNAKDSEAGFIDIFVDRHIDHACSLAGHAHARKKVIRNFSIVGRVSKPLKLDSLYISNLDLTHTPKQLIIENSKIATLRITNGIRAELNIRNTYIGKLIFMPGCLKHCDMRGGGIRQIDIDPPGSENPFTGSIWFEKTWFPTEKNMVQGAQPYRNMRHHLRSLSNMQMADLFHALELRTERRQETWTNKAISYLYDLFSDFGSSILRPVLWLILLGVSVSYVLITSDGVIPTRLLESSAVGWQTTLLGDDIFAPITRSFYLSFWSIIHPLGLFGGQPILVASTPWLSTMLIIEGIFAATLIALTIFAIRRRFKLQQA